MRAHQRGHALVVGDGPSVPAALSAARIPVTVVCGPLAAARFSRYTSGWVRAPRADEDGLVSALLEHAAGTDGPVVLYYQQDADLLTVSRRREELAEHLRFAVPSAPLVEQLVDKGGFQALAAELGLPVPPARIVDLPAAVPDLADVRLPALVKPVRRDEAWNRMSAAKAVLVTERSELQTVLQALTPTHSRVLMQHLVPGPESRIESYHVYVDPSGEIAGFFTGRKLRTRPASFGHSTALVTTDDADVAALGESIIRRLDLRGVAKLDFKRDPDGRLWLLEVNPRFNLWHHVGAAAGVNLPALVWADAVGARRPPRGTARPGVTWCKVERDWLAARDEGIGLGSWLRWLARCETRAFGDPMRWVEHAFGPAYEKVRDEAAARSGR